MALKGPVPSGDASLASLPTDRVPGLLHAHVPSSAAVTSVTLTDDAVIGTGAAAAWCGSRVC